MKCKICGSEINPGDTVCHVCGVIVDYHDYVNDPFSSAEDRINNEQNSVNNVNLTTDNYPTQVDNNFTFFSNKTTDKKADLDSKVKYIVAAVIAIILLIGFGIVLVKILAPEPKAVEGEKEIILGGNEEEVKQPEEETPEEEPKVVYKEFQGYKFKVLSGYSTSEERESLIFENRADRVEFVLSIYHTNPYATYVEKKDEVKRQWEERDYVISDYGEKQVGTVNWLILTSVYNDNPFSIVYRDFFNSSTVELLILNYGSLSNEEVYNKIEDMLISAEIANTPSGTNIKV